MDNSVEQNEELFSVESIFNVYEKNLTVEIKNPPLCGHFKANVWLPSPFYVIYKIKRNIEFTSEVCEKNTSGTERFDVNYLPPINLFFELPESYPSDSCPAFLLTCNWLTLQQISCLCKHLESMWDKGVQILYLWFQFLESEVIEFLNMQCLDITELLTFKVSNTFPELSQASAKSREENNEASGYQDSCSLRLREPLPVIKPLIDGGSGLIDCRAFNDLTDGRSLIQLLKNYNEFKRLDTFNKKYHECKVCFTSKIGADFVTFKPCNHAFCKDCLKNFFEVHIREGNVNYLHCPSEKCSSQADNSMVRQIVDKDLFERYDDILLSRTLETMADISYCPRKWCQSVVVMESDERMGCCPSCSFVFCSFCKMSYHGVAPCTFKSEEKQAIFQLYMEGDLVVKESLEKRHGKRVIKALVEDFLSENWKNSNSKNCPHCKATIEKDEGCNKMTCFRCGAFFCWLCMSLLEHGNPYSHYNERNSRCILFPEDGMDNFVDFGPGDLLHYF